MNYRDAILKGIGAANELHDQLRLRDELLTENKPVDVFGVISRLETLLLFRPLHGLLGLFMSQPAAGILVTTRRDLHVQRFTAAHELGHRVLGHRSSFDKEVGFIARGELVRDAEEIAADAFAAEFLLPKWLLAAQIDRQRWSRRDLSRPDTVYQLSLRAGLSYEATCYALSSHNLLPKPAVDALQHVPPKTSKLSALKELRAPSPWSDVWVLSERDAGLQVLGGPEDVLIVFLEEHISSGYTWDFSQAIDQGFEILLDQRFDRKDSSSFGGSVTRQIAMHGKGKTRLTFREQRKWARDVVPLKSFELDVSLFGKESDGLPRTVRSWLH